MQMYRFLRASQEVFKIHCYYGGAYSYRDETEDYKWSADAFIDLYEKKLAKKGTAARFYYEALKGQATDRKCQICHCGKAEGLDHYLPKESFPSLSIAIYNLIPCCLACNGKKSTYKPGAEGEQTIHPRYDQIFKEEWLEGVYDSVARKIVFKPNRRYHPEGSIGYSKIETHMRVHELYEMYEIKALAQIRKMVAYATAEGVEIESYINSELRKLRANASYFKNAKYTFDHWKWITCEALLKSSDFLSNGYKYFQAQARYYQDEERFEGMDVTS